MKPFRHSILALAIACLVSGCGIVLVTTATVLAIDVARDRRGASVYCCLLYTSDAADE